MCTINGMTFRASPCVFHTGTEGMMNIIDTRLSEAMRCS